MPGQTTERSIKKEQPAGKAAVEPWDREKISSRVRAYHVRKPLVWRRKSDQSTKPSPGSIRITTLVCTASYAAWRYQLQPPTPKSPPGCKLALARNRAESLITANHSTAITHLIRLSTLESARMWRLERLKLPIGRF